MHDVQNVAGALSDSHMEPKGEGLQGFAPIDLRVVLQRGLQFIVQYQRTKAFDEPVLVLDFTIFPDRLSGIYSTQLLHHLVDGANNRKTS